MAYDYIDYYIELNNAEDMFELYDILTGNNLIKS